MTVAKYTAPTGITRRFPKDNAAEVKSLLEDIERFPEFAAEFLKIQPKKGGLVPFVLNPIQMWFHMEHIVPMWKAGKPIRTIVLKSRQYGFSTYIQGIEEWFMLGRKGRRGGTIAQNEKKAKAIFRMFKRFHTKLPEPGTSILPFYPLAYASKEGFEFGKPVRRTLRNRLASKAKKLGFKYKEDEEEDGGDLEDDLGETVVILDNIIEVMSAEERDDLGRSGTYHFIHATEAAKWPELTISLATLHACVHPLPETVFIVESTANGMNAFYNLWFNESGESMGVDSEWDRVFIPWYWMPDYERAPKQKAKFVFLNDDEEQLYQRIVNDETLKQLLGLDTIPEEMVWRKLLWRRHAIADICSGSIDTFNQEYPSTDLEAFVFSGNSVFPRTAIARLEQMAREPVAQYEIVVSKMDPLPMDDDNPNIIDVRTPTGYKAVQTKGGRLKVYEMPIPGEIYVTFADSAEGRAAEGIEEKDSKYDYSCVQVLRVSQMPIRQAAIWHGTIDPDMFGYTIVGIAKFLNDAYTGWEVNGPGHSLAMQIVDHAKYGNIYMREELDTLTKRTTMKPGWRTTGSSKQDMVTVGISFVRDQMVEIYDGATIKELQSYSRLAENKYGAAAGHDDRVMALLGALVIAEPNLRYFMRKSKEFRAKQNGKHPETQFIEDDGFKTVHPVLGEIF